MYSDITPNKTPKAGIWSPDLAGPKTDLKLRECLNCEKKFMSKNRFNRVCDICKTKAEFKEG